MTHSCIAWLVLLRHDMTRHLCAYWQLHMGIVCYKEATISGLLKVIGLFCKRALKTRRYSAKETYRFKEPTNRSHPIANFSEPVMCVMTCATRWYVTWLMHVWYDSSIYDMIRVQSCTRTDSHRHCLSLSLSLAQIHIGIVSHHIS